MANYKYNPLEIKISGDDPSRMEVFFQELIRSFKKEKVGYVREPHTNKKKLSSASFYLEHNWSGRSLLRTANHDSIFHNQYDLLDADFVIIEAPSKDKSVDIYLKGKEYSTQAVREDIQTFFQQKVSEQLNGIILTGGFSKRMGQDKALINYHGQTQAAHMYSILSELCSQVALSSRKDQWQGHELNQLNQVFDALPDQGPLVGILSAFAQWPKSPLLVVACDMPNINQDLLKILIGKRNPFKFATSFVSQDSQLPEPLCTIYEPKIIPRLYQALGIGVRCPRKILLNSECELIAQPKSKNFLANINTLDEYATHKNS